MQLMNAETALRETIHLWTLLAHKPGTCKHEVPGPWNEYLFECPCCEYTKWEIKVEDCKNCPIIKQWSFYDVTHNLHFSCCEPNSPYMKWSEMVNELRDLNFQNQFLKYDIEFFCLLIVEMAKEALAELLEVD